MLLRKFLPRSTVSNWLWNGFVFFAGIYFTWGLFWGWQVLIALMSVAIINYIVNDGREI